MFLEAVSKEVARRLGSTEAHSPQWSRQHLANLLWVSCRRELKIFQTILKQFRIEINFFYSLPQFPSQFCSLKTQV